MAMQIQNAKRTLLTPHQTPSPTAAHRALQMNMGGKEGCSYVKKITYEPPAPPPWVNTGNSCHIDAYLTYMYYIWKGTQGGCETKKRCVEKPTNVPKESEFPEHLAAFFVATKALSTEDAVRYQTDVNNLKIELWRKHYASPKELTFYDKNGIMQMGNFLDHVTKDAFMLVFTRKNTTYDRIYNLLKKRKQEFYVTQWCSNTFDEASKPRFPPVVRVKDNVTGEMINMTQTPYMTIVHNADHFFTIHYYNWLYNMVVNGGKHRMVKRGAFLSFSFFLFTTLLYMFFLYKDIVFLFTNTTALYLPYV